MSTSPVRAVFRNRAGHLRAGWRMVIYLSIVMLIVLAAAGISRLFRGEGHVRVSTGDEGFDSWQSVTGFSILNLILIAAACVVLRFIDRRPCGLLGLGISRRTPVEICAGCAIGCGVIMISCVTLWSAGLLTVGPGRGDGSFAASVAWLAVVFLVAAAAEELLNRGYPFQAAVEGMGAPLAVAVFGVIFGLGHASNQGSTWVGIATTGASGVLMSIAYLRTRSLWMPIAIHVSWNWTQGCVWGIKVSGMSVESSLLRTVPVDPEWLSGGDFGAEGSLITLVLSVLFSVYVYRAPWLRPSTQNASLWEPHASRGTLAAETGASDSAQDMVHPLVDPRDT